MNTFLRVILGIALVGSAAYFLFAKGNTFMYKIPNFGLGRNEIVSMASSTAENIKNKASDSFSEFTDQLQNKAEDIISSSVSSAKNYAFDIFRQGIEDSVNKLGEKAGITGVNINSAATSTDSYIVYSVKKGVNAYFTIKNNDADSLKYKVDWLDNNVSSGELAEKDASIVLTHKWSKAGEYLISFNIENSMGTKIYRVKISVID